MVSALTEKINLIHEFALKQGSNDGHIDISSFIMLVAIHLYRLG